MRIFDDLVDRIFGPWCQALDPNEEATCWKRVGRRQPGGFCDDCWLRLAKDGDISQRAEMAGESSVPPFAVDVLLNDPSPMVKTALAKNMAALLPEHVEILCAENQPSRVLINMAERPDLSLDNELSLIESGDVATARKLAANKDAKSRTRHLLSQHPEQSVRDMANRRARG